MRKVKLFIAGSTTEVGNERSVINDAIAEWNSSSNLLDGTRSLEFLPFSYLSFSNVIDHKTGNYKYNRFIKDECDLIVFILSGDAQKKTMEEFQIAFDSLHGKRNAPRILVFNNSNTELSENAKAIREMLSDNDKYWINYDSPEHLKYLMKEQLTNIAPFFHDTHSRGILKWIVGVLGIVGLSLLLYWGLISNNGFLSKYKCERSINRLSSLTESRVFMDLGEVEDEETAYISAAKNEVQNNLSNIKSTFTSLSSVSYYDKSSITNFLTQLLELIRQSTSAINTFQKHISFLKGKTGLENNMSDNLNSTGNRSHEKITKIISIGEAIVDDYRYSTPPLETVLTTVLSDVYRGDLPSATALITGSEVQNYIATCIDCLTKVMEIENNRAVEVINAYK